MLTDGRTDELTDGKPDPYIAPCLRQARQKRIVNTDVVNDATLMH